MLRKRRGVGQTGEVDSCPFKVLVSKLDDTGSMVDLEGIQLWCQVSDPVSLLSFLLSTPTGLGTSGGTGVSMQMAIVSRHAQSFLVLWIFLIGHFNLSEIKLVISYQIFDHEGGSLSYVLGNQKQTSELQGRQSNTEEFHRGSGYLPHWFYI